MPSSVQTSSPSRGFPGSSFIYTPLQHVRVLFISFLQGLFVGAPKGCFRWDPVEERSDIIIRDENPLNVETVQKRPSINVTMGAVQFYSLGIDDMLYYDFRTSKKTKGVLVPGTMAVNCCSRSDIEAHNLAWIVSEHIWLLRELFLKMGFFELGRGNQISPPSPPGSIVTGDQGSEWYCSSVSVPFQFQRKSAFTPLGQEIVQNIETALRTTNHRVASLGPAQAGHEYPLAVNVCPPPPYAPGASDVYGATPDPAGARDVFLPKQPHPLNPAASVVVRTARPFRAGVVRPPSMNGRALPLVRPCVEQS